MEGFDEFVASRLPSLLRFATVLCVDTGLAEDVVQDVLLKVHGRWPDVAGLDRTEAYVRRMIVNEYLSWRRKWSRVVPAGEIAPSTDVADHAEQHAERDALFQRLTALPPRQRAVIVLRYYGGLDDAGIARELGCAVGTVRSLVSRAMAALRIQQHTSEKEEARHAH